MEPDIILDENMELNQYGFRGSIIHAPGHTAGSVIVYLEGGETFVGDTLIGISNKHIFPPFADHTELLLESWKKMLDMPATYFYPGHGMKISKHALEKEYPVAKKRYGKG